MNVGEDAELSSNQGAAVNSAKPGVFKATSRGNTEPPNARVGAEAPEGDLVQLPEV